MDLVVYGNEVHVYLILSLDFDQESLCENCMVSCLKSLFNSFSRKIFICIKQYYFLSVASPMTYTSEFMV